MKHRMLLIILLLAATVAFAQNPDASIKEIIGTVELKASGSADWKPASQGDRLENDTVISTGFKSTAVLAIGGSTLTVRPLTRLSLNELMIREGTESINVGLRTGRVQVSVTPPAGGRTDFAIRIPPATASVRGTVFDIDSTSIWVLEGNVGFAGVYGTGRPVQVITGMNTTIDTNTGNAMQPLVKMEMDRRLPTLIGGGGTIYSPWRRGGVDSAPDIGRQEGWGSFTPSGISAAPGEPINITINPSAK